MKKRNTTSVNTPLMRWLGRLISQVCLLMSGCKACHSRLPLPWILFVGYVMLDAWIANQDRHHQNWAILWDGERPQGERLRLAPTFDHGASLARNLSDKERKERLTSKDRNRQVLKFAARARSAFYDQVSDTRVLGTHEAFWQFSKAAPKAARDWLKQLESIKTASMQAILDKVPDQRMSKTAKEFTLQLLLVNQQRLLEAPPT